MAAVNFSFAEITPIGVSPYDYFGIAQGFSGGDLEFVANLWNAEVDEGEYQVAGSYFTIDPSILADPSLEFDPVSLGGQSTRLIEIRNTGILPVDVNAIAAPFGFEAANFQPLNLDVGESTFITVQLTGIQTGIMAGDFSIQFDSLHGQNIFEFEVVGEVFPAYLQVNVDGVPYENAVDFGALAIGEMEIGETVQ